MSPTDPKIQVISRTDHTDHHLIPIPQPTTPLAPSTIRVRPSLLSLIVNTLTCAAHPEIKIGWWDVHPLPASTPAPFNDATKYGRIGVWGWGTVLASTVSNITESSRVYGFFPIADLPVDLQLQATDAPGVWRETSPERASALKMYNTYEVHPALGKDVGKEEKTSQALDALAKPTFRLGYLLARYSFDPKWHVSPVSPEFPWSASDADLNDAVVVLAAATSKSALGLAYMLSRKDSPSKPARVVALTSEASASFARETGWYTDVVTYKEAESVAKLDVIGRKVVVVEFGAREDAAARAVGAVMQEGAAAVKILAVGAEAKKDSMKFTPEVVGEMIEQGIVFVSIPAMIDTVEERLGPKGEAVLNEEFDSVWMEFKKQGFPGMKIAWGNGVEEYAKAYEKMCNGEVRADTSLVFKI